MLVNIRAAASCHLNAERQHGADGGGDQMGNQMGVAGSGARKMHVEETDLRQ